MKVIGIFGDLPTASTGMAIVLKNLANELTRKYRVIYFGRFGQEKEFAKRPTLLGDNHFEYVPTQGGVWERELVVRILNHYKNVDYVFCEDDGFSAYGITKAAEFQHKPFHLLTPIDSLPVHPQIVNDVFLNCTKIYVPNSSYKIFDNIKRSIYSGVSGAQPTLKSVYLPHGCNTEIFYPKKLERSSKFTFLWIGRIERRKNPLAFIQAAERVSKLADVHFLMRTDWNTPFGKMYKDYITRKKLPFTFDQMADVPHEEMNLVYNKADVNICTAMAGGFEMSINEAGACRVPSLCTDWTFMNENVLHEKSGILIPVSDYTHPPSPDPREFRTSDIAQDRVWGEISVDSLSTYMLWCYNNIKHVRHMGGYAREHIKENFSWKKIADRLGDEISES